MQLALAQFQENIKRVRAFMVFYNAINSRTTAIIDNSDILRAAIVFSVSALDKFIHDVTRMGLLEIFQGTRPETESYLRFQLSMKMFTLLQTCDETIRLNLFDAEIRERQGWQSFQRPDKIADALRLIVTIRLWDELAKELRIEVKEANFCSECGKPLPKRKEAKGFLANLLKWSHIFLKGALILFNIAVLFFWIWYELRLKNRRWEVAVWVF